MCTFNSSLMISNVIFIEHEGGISAVKISNDNSSIMAGTEMVNLVYSSYRKTLILKPHWHRLLAFHFSFQNIKTEMKNADVFF